MPTMISKCRIMWKHKEWLIWAVVYKYICQFSVSAFNFVVFTAYESN